MKKIVIALIGVVGMSAWAQSISIIEPSQSRAYHRPAQSIDIKVQTDGISRLDNVAVLFDGERLGANAREFSLPTHEMNAGEHTIVAQIQDAYGRVIASDSRVVYIINAGKVAAARKQYNEAMAHYDAKPALVKLFSKKPEYPTNVPNASMIGTAGHGF